MYEKSKLVIEYNKNSKDLTIQSLIRELKHYLEINDVENIKRVMELYNTYVLEIWLKEMTKPEDYKQGEDFKFLVHNLTKDDFYEEFATDLVSGSLITNQCMGLCGESTVGFTLVPSNIKAAVPYDLYTSNGYYPKCFSYEDYLNRDYSKAFRFSAIILPPDAIVESVLQETIKLNGEMLNNDRSKVFSEIASEGFFPNAIYVVTSGEKEINPDYVRALNLNKKYMFTFLDIDKSLYRIKNGLEPLTDMEQIRLVMNLFSYTNTSVENYEKLRLSIYKLFLSLKEKEIYTPELFVHEFQKIK